MSTVYVNYSSLELSIKKAETISGKISDYCDELKTYLKDKADELNNSEYSGYMSAVSSQAQRKMNALVAKQTKLSTYKNKVQNVIDTAQAKDNYVSSEIDKTAALANEIAKSRKGLKGVVDWIYQTFCVDVANSNAILRFISDVAKTVITSVEGIANSVKDWFKYGRGKYVWNVIKAVGGAVLAVGAAVTAIATLVATTGTLAIIVAVVGAAAATIAAVIAVANGVFSLWNNGKARVLDFIGEDGGARYYSEVSKVSDHFKKNDFGGKETNEIFEFAGKVIDTTKVVADTTTFVTNIFNLTAARDYRKNPTYNLNENVNAGKWNQGYDFSKENIIKNLEHSMGYRWVKNDAGKYEYKLTFKNAFNGGDSLKWSKAKKSKYTVYLDGKPVQFMPDGFIEVANFFKNTKNYTGLIENLNDIHTFNHNPTVANYSGFVEGIAELAASNDGLSFIKDLGLETGKTVVDIIELFQK